MSDDEGLLINPAERILAGQIPYRDFFSELAPGTFYIHALFFRVFGTHIGTARIAVLVVVTGIALLLYHLGLKLMPAWAAAIPVLIYSTTAFTRWLVPSHHWYSLFFALVALVSLTNYLERRQSRWVLLSGICTSAAGLCMQNKGALLFVGALIILGIDSRRNRRQGRRTSPMGYAWYFCGAVLPAVVCLSYFYHHGALKDLYYATAVFLWQSYIPYEYQPIPYLPSQLLQSVRSLAADVNLTGSGKFLSSITWSLLIPVMSVLYVARTVRRNSAVERENHSTGIQYALFIVGLCLYLSEMHRFDFVHSLFGTPLLLVLAVALYYDLGFREAPRSWIAVALLACMTIFHLGYGVLLAQREARRESPVYTRRGVLYQTSHRASRYQAILDAIQSRVSEKSAMFCYPYSATLYFLTGTVNPTRYDYLLPGETTPAQFEEAISVLKGKQAPQYVFSFWRERRHQMLHWFPNASRHHFLSHPIEDFLMSPESPYKPVVEKRSFVIFEKVP